MADEQAAKAVERSAILKGEKIFFAPDHFDEDIATILTGFAEELGADIVTGRQQASVILLNPASLAYKPELERIATFRRSHPTLDQLVVPYHWLSRCHYLIQRLDPAKLEPARPIFTNPDRSRGYQPLRAWVSVNIVRSTNEDAHQAHAAVSELLAKGGALLVKKRAMADVFIVDPDSKFYKTIKDERDKNGRTHQRLAERDWVEDCFANRTVAWRSEREEAAANAQDEDSFGEEDVTSRGKGPGRPTGIPRKEYTPADDDFLCRFLAAHYPDGAWQSRKTYTNLVALKDTYPPAAQHSSQSWHERFKKNSAVFARRVQTLSEAGIDGTLKTRAERAKEQEKQREADAAAALKAAAEPATVSTADSVAGPSRAVPASPAKTPKKRMEAAISSKKILVELDSESNPIAAATKVINSVEHPSAQQPLSQVHALEQIPEQGGASGPADAALEQTARVKAGEDFESLLPPQPTADAIPKTLHGDSAIVDASLRNDPSQDLRPSQGSQADQGEGEGESQRTNGSGDHPTAGAETQAILSDFQKAKAAVRAAQRTTTAALSASSDTAARSTARGSSMPRSPRQVPQPPQAPHTEPIRQAEFQPQSRRSEGPHPQPPRSAIRAPRISEGADGRQIVSIPVTVNFRPVLPTTDGSTEDDTDLDQQQQHERVRRQRERFSSGGVGEGAVHTPSPGARKSLLREELMNSSAASAASARRRSRLSYNPNIEQLMSDDGIYGSGGGGGGSSKRQRRKHQSPDTVYATPAIPAPILRPAPPNGALPPSIRRRPSPPLEDHERRDKVYAGQATVKARAAQYKANITRLCDKYGVSPRDLHASLDEVKREGEFGLPWDELEQRLDELFAQDDV